MTFRARDALAAVALALGTLALLRAPSPRALVAHGASDSAAAAARARVVAADDSEIQRHDLIEFGTQRLTVEFPDGRRAEALNELRAQLELDKKFVPGDTALVVGDAAPYVARDHWRLGGIALLFGAFAALLVAFAGWTGAKALFSFAFSCLAVWKILVPLCLAGWDARLTSLACVTVLTGVIMFLVAGWTRLALAATLGALAGVAASLALADVSAALLKVNGATLPFVQTLLYSGLPDLKLGDVFAGAVILASSGAVMDLAMDVASAVAEVARHRPDLPRRALMASGLRVGRNVVGTMTTTLLLAYSGGYLTLLMVFAAQGTAPADFINSTLVSAEIVKTLVGSIGLVLVAPLTALAAAFLFARKQIRHA